MLGSLEKQLDLSDLDLRLGNLSKRQNCGTPVCPGLNYLPSCDVAASGQKCLVAYHYPMNLGEILEVAESAKYEETLKFSDPEALQEETETVKKEKLPEFSPDWRFWSGISLAGLGLFLYRKR